MLLVLVWLLFASAFSPPSILAHQCREDVAKKGTAADDTVLVFKENSLPPLPTPTECRRGRGCLKWLGPAGLRGARGSNGRRLSCMSTTGVLCKGQNGKGCTVPVVHAMIVYKRLSEFAFCLWAQKSKFWYEAPYLVEEAIKLKNSRMAEMLIERGALEQIPVNDSVRFSSYLHLAVGRNLTRVAAAIVARRREGTAEARDEFGRTPLWLAAFHGHVEVMRLLIIEAGADLEARSGEFATSIKDDGEGVLPPGRKITNNPPYFGTYEGSTPLFVAAQNGDLRACDMLLKYGADVEAARTSTDNATALMAAVANNHTEVSRLLLKSGADMQRSDAHGESVPDLIVKADNLALYKAVNIDLHLTRERSYEADLDLGIVHHSKTVVFQTNVLTPPQLPSILWKYLVKMSRNGFLEGIEEVFSRFGIGDLGDRTEVGDALVAAAANNQTETVRWLLIKGADPDSVGAVEEFEIGKPKQTTTALVEAADRGYLDVYQKLVAYGGDELKASTTYDGARRTPLQIVMCCRREEILQWRLDRGLRRRSSSSSSSSSSGSPSPSLSPCSDRTFRQLLRDALAAGRETCPDATDAVVKGTLTDFIVERC